MTAPGTAAAPLKSSLQPLRYRADIDGLRAIAVTAVILYHAKVPGFAGGYVGVDVFFVISGYLITGLLESSKDRYGLRLLGEFYSRRARRLLPALYVLLGVSTAIALVLFFPADLKQFGRSLLLATAFLGNVGAWLDGGYFDPGERFTPLRHLWSIGVEEQFYLFFPLLLFAIAGVPRPKQRVLVALLASISLLMSFVATARWPIQNYFMLPTRAWELLIGAFVAITPSLSGGSARTNQILSAAGLAGVAAVVWQARVIGFPGIATTSACVGAALLIASNTTSLTWVGRVLTQRPLVFTGLISYSLYLWHAPLLAFYSYFNIKDPTPIELALVLATVYLIAWFSWSAIELPFRSGSKSNRQRSLAAVAIPATAFLAACGYWLMTSEGLPHRLEYQPASMTADAAQYSRLEPRCFTQSAQKIAAGELCSFGPQDESAKRVVVWGDSHAFALLPAYRELANATGVRIYFGVRGACWPLLGSEAGGEFWRARCAEFNAAMAQALYRIKPQRVLLNAYWLDPDAPTEPVWHQRADEQSSTVTASIRRTVAAARAAGASVCAVLTVPGYPYPVPYALAMARRRHIGVGTLSMTRAAARDEYRTVEGDLRSLAAQQELQTADPKDVLCEEARCLILDAAGESLYRDATHLSIAGTRMLTNLLKSCIAER